MARPKNSGGASRPLEQHEIKRLLNITSKTGRNRERNTILIKMLLFSAGRIGEVLSLKVSSVFNGDEILPSFVFTKTKNGIPRRIPINDGFKCELLSYIKETNLKLDDPLFPSSRFTNGSRFINPNAGSLLVKRLMVQAGLGDCSAHSTRKASLMTMMRSGANWTVLQNIAGHQSASALQKYLSASKPEINNAINSLNF